MDTPTPYFSSNYPTVSASLDQAGSYIGYETDDHTIVVYYTIPNAEFMAIVLGLFTLIMVGAFWKWLKRLVI